MVNLDTSDFEAALEIGDELNADLLDNLLDTVLDEVKSKQRANAKEPDEQIMPTASPNIYETDLMDDLDTPFHHDDGDTSFGSHKTISLSHQEHGFSPDHFPDNWSFDYIDEFSRKNNLFENSVTQTRDQSGVAGSSYPAINKAAISTEYDINMKCVSAEASNLSISKLNFEQPNSQIKSEIFECQSSKSVPSRNIPADIKSSKDYDSLKQYPDFPQLLYTESSQPSHISDIPSHQPSHSMSDGQVHYHQNNPDLQQRSIFQDEDSKDTFMSWTCKHPENWTEAEVLDWIFYSAERNRIDCSHLHGEAFHTVTGRDLCRMGIDEFRKLEPQFGQYFYELFRQLLNGLRFTQPNDILEVETQICSPEDRTIQRHIDDSFSPKTFTSGHQQGDIYYQAQSASPGSPENYYAYQQARNYTLEYGHSSVYSSQALPESHLLQSYDYSSGGQDIRYEPGYSYDYPTQTYQERSTYRSFKAEKASVTSKYAGVSITPRRRPGRPRIKSLPTEEEIRLRQEKKLKSQPLWEFIFDLLNNPVYNPQVLKWENQKEGMFRFIQSETIAQLWGNLKNNENMTYEKLSRAMRHYYKRDILERVEGRRLVYKFSLSTLQRMREKRQAAYQNASNDIATASKVTSHRLDEKCINSMQTTTNDVNSNVLFPRSEEKQFVYMQSTTGQVTSASDGAVQFESNDHAHVMTSNSTLQFSDDEHMNNVTSHDVSELSNASFQRVEEKHLISIPELPNNFSSPPNVTIQNFESNSPASLQAVYV